MKIVKNRLVEGGLVQKYRRPKRSKNPTAKTYGAFDAGMLEAVIIHFTAAGTKSTLSTLRGEAGVSVQIVIDPNGKIYQMLDFNEIAWHAGKSEWDGREDWNRRSIGIELVNYGPITKDDNGVYRNLYRGRVSQEDVFMGKHKNDSAESFLWHKFPQAQLDSAYQLTRLLVQTYNLPLVLGHDDISPVRKVDPGPAFPMEDFQNAVYSQSTTGETAFKDPRSFLPFGKAKVHTPGDFLNLRSQPIIKASTKIGAMAHGSEVDILDDTYHQSATKGRVNNRWIQIRGTVNGVKREGYVSKRYITTNMNPPPMVASRGGLFGEEQSEGLE
ncbi:MAG: N-acetylmuramoyl-L-alanine amidase [Bacteroidota bacterium]